MVSRDGTLHKSPDLDKLETTWDQENLEPSHLPLASQKNRQCVDKYDT